MEITYPLPGHPALCMVVANFLSAQQCRDLIAMSEARGFDAAAANYPPSYRNNERLVRDDAPLAAALLRRLDGIAPARLGQWALDAVNPRMRFCRYRPGQQFAIHQDGVHHRGPGHQSRLTLMVYLSDGASFAGGDTVFYADGPGKAPHEIGRVTPQAGSLILFDHSLWHAGEIVTAGVKHIMRSDLLYRCARQQERAGPFTPAHQGYVWALERLADGGVASGGRDATIRLWSAEGAARGQLAGHTQSVLGLAALPGARLASVSRDRSLRLWDLASGRCERSVEAHAGAVLAVASLADGAIATGGADGLLKLWEGDGRPRAVLHGHRGWVWALDALAALDAPDALDDGLCASASEDGDIRLWDWRSGRCLHTLAGGVALRTLAAGGALIVAGDIAGAVHIWRQVDGAWRRQRALQAHSGAVRRVRFVQPGILATAGEDNFLRLWRLDDGALLHQAEHGNFVSDVVALGDGYLSSSYDGRLATTFIAAPVAP